MDELDRIARAAVDELQARAADTDTEQALADLHGGVRLAPVVAQEDPPQRHRRPLLAAAALVAVLAVGAAVWTAGDDEARIAPADTTTAPDVSTDDSTSPSTVPATIPVTAPAATVPESVPDTTTDSPGAEPVDLGHGLLATVLPAEPERIRSVETFGYTALARADSVVQLWFAEGSSVRIRLGTLDTSRYPVRDDAPELGLGGWTLDGLEGEVAAAVGYGLDEETWFTVEAIRSYDLEASQFLDDAPSLEEIRSMLLGLRYDPLVDDRTRATTDSSPRLSSEQLSPCEQDIEVSGTGGRGDLVLFTCDGLLARYDGDTGERLQVLATFPDPTGPQPEEGSSSYVDSIVVSPDGTIWWSVGPEPVSDTLYRFTPGVSTEPEPVGSGIVHSASPDGKWVAAVTAMPSVDLRQVDRTFVVEEGEPLPAFDTWGTFVSSPVWSPDGRTVAAEVADRGVVAVMDVQTGSIRYHAPLERQMYLSPWFDADGVLHAVLANGMTMQEAVVGPPGNAVPQSVASLSVPDLGRVPLSAAPSGVFASLQAGMLGFEGDIWATGVIAAAVVPPES